MEKNDLLAKLKPEIDIVDKTMQGDMQGMLSKGLIPASLFDVLDHALFNGGKRIRPLLCILTGALCGCRKKEIYSLATAFEYLHVATLLHDDVIDHADTRRGMPTANNIYGLTPAILAGDFLHARSMHLVGTIGGKRCLELICNATESMVAGEFLQIANVENFNQSADDYFAVINGKTALFIGAVCETGGIYAGAPDQQIQALKTYGSNLGMAFQIQDDLLDYLGDESRTGKTVGNDFLEGKMTLPLIYALSAAGKTEQAFLLSLLKGEKNARLDGLEEATKIIDSCGGFSHAHQLAEKLIDTGIECLGIFTSGHSGQVLAILTGLARYVIQRDK